MSMPTPTGDAMTGLPGWMPDEATLTRMANEFFGDLQVSESAAALPSAASSGPSGYPAPELPVGLDTDLPVRPAVGPPVSPGASVPVQPNGVRQLPSGIAPLSHPGFDAGVLPGLQAPIPAAAQVPVQPRGMLPIQAGVTLPEFPGVEFPVIPGFEPPGQPLAELPGAHTAAIPLGDPAGAALPGGLAVGAAPNPQPGTITPTGAGPAFDLYAGRPSVPSFYFVNDLPSSAVPPPAVSADTRPLFDVEAVRQDFPILRERVHGRQLVWLDNAAATQKPQAVIDRLAYFYAHENSNIHRAAHALAARATDAYEGARSTVADFLGASSGEDIVFTRGTTEAINLVAQAWGRQHIGPGDEIVISHLEHHANIVPWQQLAQQTGAKLKVIPVDDDGQVLLDAYTDLLSERTRMVAVSQVSNVVGTIVPVREVIQAAHRVGARVLIDGAQAVAHLPVDVQAMDADFYVFSGHKIYAPTGIGALYGKPEALEEMPPWQGGGNMISDVTLERALYQRAPAKFEAGTGNIADAVGLGAALDYVSGLGLPIMEQYERQLLDYATREMNTVPGLCLIGTAPEKVSVLTFVLDGYQPEEVGSALDQQGIAVRAGHHCAQPILRRYGLESAVRPSLTMYNTCAEVDLLVAALHKLAADAGRRR
jgi:cysteine desulfurase/selenocysteine lyase